MKNHISIILVNYNTPDDTRDCIESLSKINHRGFDYNVIVVENGSKEPLKFSQAFLRKYPFVELVLSESNLGFTGGNNLGIKHALDVHDSDYCLLLNSDTVVDSNFLQELHNLMKRDPKIGLSVSKMYFHKGFEFWDKSYEKKDQHRVVWYAGGKVDWTSLSSFHIGVDEIDRGQFDREAETDFATGCCVLISREVIERVGLLDDKFFLYSEDVDLSLRVRKAGLKVVYCPSSVIWHKIGRSSGGAGSPLQQYYQTRNRLLLTFKHADFRRKITAIRLAFNLLKNGNPSERKAVLDLIKGNLGKQAYV